VQTSSTSLTDESLKRIPRRHDFFVGIDSDGCVFDTMEIKQKKCFHPLIVSHWHLEPIERYVREAAEFINLYSKWRGQNRFPCLVRSIDIIRDRPEVLASGVKLPEFKALRRFMDSGVPLSNSELKKAAGQTGDAELADVLKWSEDVNKTIAKTVTKVPPYEWARRSLEKIAAGADSIVVSQTPSEALVREWDENNLTGLVLAIAGQELGTKSEHIATATQGRYKAENVMMIGDAPGDLKAARENNARFFPVNPGHENASWKVFHEEAFDRFLSGRYDSVYERRLVDEFLTALPDTPAWKRN